MTIIDELEKEYQEVPVFKAILDSLPEMILIFEENRKLIKINDRVKRFLDENEDVAFSPEDDEKFVCKMDFEFDENDHPFAKDCFIRNIVTEVFTSKQEIKNRRGFLDVYFGRKRNRIRVLLNATPVEHEGTDYVVVTIRDIQNIKKYEEQHFKDMQKFSIIGASVSTIVHDLKNPLTGLMGYLELLKLSDSPERKILLIEKMSNSVDKLQHMLEEILNIASGSEEQILDKRWLDVKEIFFEVINLQNMPHLIKLEIEPDLKFVGDKVKLHNVFWNLIKNAEESLNTEEGKIYVKAKRADDKILFEIKDTGKGIPQYVQESIFELGATFGKANGTGFGLASVKKIIESHKGEIKFESAVGKGTTFYITLPIK
jgi:signal transduction histidine kinase